MGPMVSMWPMGPMEPMGPTGPMGPMGPMGHLPGATGPNGPRTETYLFREPVLVEMVQFVAFPGQRNRPLCNFQPSHVAL